MAPASCPPPELARPSPMIPLNLAQPGGDGQDGLSVECHPQTNLRYSSPPHAGMFPSCQGAPKKGVHLGSLATAVYTDRRLVGTHNPATRGRSAPAPGSAHHLYMG